MTAARAAAEAWLMETPTLVNGNCKVLKQQTRSSNGGLYYYTYDEFSTALQLLLDDVGLRRQLGRQGRSFVAANYEWELVMAKFTAVLLVPTAIVWLRRWRWAAQPDPFSST